MSSGLWRLCLKSTLAKGQGKRRLENVLLSGTPGVGKTTLIRRVLEPFRAEVGGFFTSELREGGRRVGFGITSLDGEQGVLAHIGIKGPFRVGKYGVDLGCLERIGVGALRGAICEKRLVVIDEIGKMELLSERFQEVVWEVLASSRPVLGTLTLARTSFTDQIRSRSDVEIVEVRRDNREALGEILRAKVRAVLRSGRQDAPRSEDVGRTRRR